MIYQPTKNRLNYKHHYNINQLMKPRVERTLAGIVFWFTCVCMHGSKNTIPDQVCISVLGWVSIYYLWGLV